MFVAAAFILVALIITFGTASVLQGIATARRDVGTTTPAPVVAEPAKTTPAKLKASEQARQAILAARRAG